ncbi:Transcriptional regulator, ArsR family [hydrothermal vent metagenome]|uniref:Transcriptional regulator, ArsR family n=1 Tax=hydrothermal vent metagenome TaxID=652676 RepID=A0A3B1BDB6_9ZZZZ
MPERSPKKLLFEQLARVGKALSSSSRLELLEFLAQGEKGVEALAKVSGLSVANTSQHLQNLRNAGLVESRKSGQKVFYSLSDDSTVTLLGTIRHIAENNLAELDLLINTYLKERDALEPIPAEELLKRAEEGLVTVIDVRPSDEYAAGHVAGAVNVPINELTNFIRSLNPGQEIVAYCRGAYCLMSFDAVKALRKKGFKAKRLEDGFPEWKYGGHPVETGE